MRPRAAINEVDERLLAEDPEPVKVLSPIVN
jgi:hypothetical protein